MLWFAGKFVSEAEDSFFDVVGHVEADGSFDIVPVEGYAAEELALPVGGELVFFLEMVDEVEHIIFGDEFDAEIIDNEDEVDGPSEVFE